MSKAWTPDARLPDGLYLRDAFVVRVAAQRSAGSARVSRGAASRLEFLHGVPRIEAGLYAAIDAGAFRPITNVRETVRAAGGLFSFTAVRVLRGS